MAYSCGPFPKSSLYYDQKHLKIINGFPFEQHTPEKITSEQSEAQLQAFLTTMLKRRSVRNFSNEPVPEKIIKKILEVANTAPSGANKQPWAFCAIKNPGLKKQIREAAEKEEYESYNGRMPQEWLDDLAPLQTDWKKEFLETAPWLIVVFKKIFGLNEAGKKSTYYYVQESTGIATGFLISAIHAAGLCTLTHTPSPMNFLSKLLQRPDNEKPFLLLPVGYAAADCLVPVLKKKTVEDVSRFYL